MDVINFKQTKDQIADIIRHEIITGGLEEGIEIAQTYMAELLGVSRMPIREAFHLLEQEGFLKRLPNRHMKVVGLKYINIQRYISVLSAIETEILIMIRSEKVKIDSIVKIKEQYYENLHKQTNEEKILNLIIQFHYELSIILDDAYVIKTHHQLLGGLFFYCINHCDQDTNKIYEQMEALITYLINSINEPRLLIETHIKEVLNDILKERE